MMTKEGSTKIVNFMSPGAGVLVLGGGRTVKIEYFFSFSCLQRGMNQTDYVLYSNDDLKGSSKIVNFISPEAGVLILGHGHVSHYSENAYLLLYQYKAH